MELLKAWATKNYAASVLALGPMAGLCVPGRGCLFSFVHLHQHSALHRETHVSDLTLIRILLHS